MKPFFIEIPKYWLGQTIWADTFWGIWGIFGWFISPHFDTASVLSMFSSSQSLFLQKKLSLYIQIPNIYLRLWFEFGLLVSVVHEPNYPWFDRNSQPKPDRPRGKKWVGKNDGSHTSSKTIVACFTTADLTPALITGPVELGGAWAKIQSSAPLPHQLLVEPEVKLFPSKTFWYYIPPTPSYSYLPLVLLHTTSCTLPSMILPRFIKISGVSKAG